MKPDDDYFAVLDAAIGRFARVDPQTLVLPVPACPGWNVADVFTHTTQVHRWATRVIESHATERVPFGDAELPPQAELITFFAEGAAALRTALHAADLDEIVFTWAGAEPIRWWLRRQAHETVVHAWDVQAATSQADAIAPWVAIDGIDEFFDVFVPRRFKTTLFAGRGETMHLHATDAESGEGEWLMRFESEAITVTREHAKGDVAVRGSASDLLLFVWNRVGYETLETFGDTTILDRFAEVAAF